MDSFLDVVKRVTPIKTNGSAPAIGNSGTNTEVNQANQTEPEGIQETQLTANTTNWKVQMKVLIPSLILMDVQEME